MRYVERIDLYGLKADMRTFGKHTFKTWLGGLLTVLTVLMVAATSFLFGQDFWFKTNPRVVLGKIVPEKSELIYPSSSNFTILFRLEDILGNKQEDKEKLLIPNFIYYHYKKDSNKEWKEILIVDSPGTKCSETQAKDNSDISNLDLTQFNCINWEEIAEIGQKEGIENYSPVLGGTWEEDEIAYFAIELRNYNFNSQGIKIYSEFSKIKDFITQSDKYISVFYPESLFDASDLDKPLNKFWKNYFYNVSHTMARRDRFFFSLVKLEDDSGWIFKDTNNSFAITKSNTEVEMSILNDVSDLETRIYYFIFYLERPQQEIKRSYMKVQELGAMLGGFVKIVHLIFGLAASQYCKYKRNMFIHEKINKKLSLPGSLDQSKSISATNNYINPKTIKEKKQLKISFLKVMFSFCFKKDKHLEQFELFDSSVNEKIDIQTLFSLSDRIASIEAKIGSNDK